MAAGTISSATKLPLGLVITLATMVISGVAAFAVNQNETGHLKEDMAEVRSAHASSAVETRDLDRRVQKAEDNYAAVLETLKDIKADVRQIREAHRQGLK